MREPSFVEPPSVVEESPPLRHATPYTIDQLVAVLGEPLVRKNVARPKPNPAASSRKPRTTILAPTPNPANDKPRAGFMQVLVWNCSGAGGGCMAIGDPFGNKWYAGPLCVKHGGVPYDMATPAAAEQFAKRETWIRAFWEHLQNIFGPIEQTSDFETTCGPYRVLMSQAKPGESISMVSSVYCRSWRLTRSAEETELFMGTFSAINASPREAVIDVMIRSQEDRTVELHVKGEGWVRGRVAGRYPDQITLRSRDGTKRVFPDDSIIGFREAKRSPRSVTVDSKRG